MPSFHLCPETSLCPCLSWSLAAFIFLGPCPSAPVYLCVSVSVCVSVPYHSGCVCLSLQLSTWLCPSASVSLCLSVDSPSLYFSVTAFLCLFLLPFTSSSPILRLAAPGGCSSPTGQPGDTSGHCLVSPSRSPPHARHLGTASIFPLQLWGVRGGYSGGKTQCPVSICSGALGPLTLSAAIKGAGSQGSERIMIASAKQPRSRQPLGE